MCCFANPAHIHLFIQVEHLHLFVLVFAMVDVGRRRSRSPVRISIIGWIGFKKFEGMHAGDATRAAAQDARRAAASDAAHRVAAQDEARRVMIEAAQDEARRVWDYDAMVSDDDDDLRR